MAHLQIHPESCEHQILARARCSACVQACPHAAWQLHDDGLSFDEDICDDCGLCVAACPNEALSLPAILPEVLVGSDGRTELIVACEKAGQAVAGESPETGSRTDRVGITPCIDALSPDWVLEWSGAWHGAQVRTVRGACTTCPRHTHFSFDVRWDVVATRLHAAGLPAALVAPLTVPQWKALARDGNQPSRSRRQWLARLTRKLSEPAQTSLANSPLSLRPLTSGRRKTLELLRQSGVFNSRRAVPPLWAIAIDNSKCTSCKACAQVCQGEAIVWDETGGEIPADAAQAPATQAALVMDMTRCNHCGLCLTVCDQGALHDDPYPQPVNRPQRHLRHRQACSRCKQVYWTCAEDSAALCTICQGGRPAQYNRLIQPES